MYKLEVINFVEKVHNSANPIAIEGGELSASLIMCAARNLNRRHFNKIP